MSESQPIAAARSGAVRRLVASCVRPFANRAARAYIAGDSLDQAVAVALRLTAADRQATIGYWNGVDEPIDRVAAEYRAGIERLAAQLSDAYLSIKLPALNFSETLLDELAASASTRGIRLHCDSLGPETVEATQRSVDRLLDRFGQLRLGVTLPGRWSRSASDAQWACQRQLPVRVVKGQWTDPQNPHLDPAAGFLATIDALAGRATHVSVASHDVVLAREAIARLRAAGTACDWELLYGLPRRAAERAAVALNSPVRVYVPYGAAYLPYAVSHAVRNPRVAWWLLKDIAMRPLAAIGAALRPRGASTGLSS